MKFQKNAVSISWVLIASLLIFIAIFAFGFTYVSNMLKAQATATNHSKIDNELAEQEITKLRSLSRYLEENKDTVQRASEVVAESQAYTYQNQGIADLNTYANRVGVNIIGIDFPDVSKQTQKPGTANISGVKRIPIVVRLSQQVDYANFLKFIKSIEQNLTKMQITAVTMTPDPKAPGKLTSPSLNVEVFIR